MTESDDVNLSRLRQLALEGKEYEEEFTYEYRDEDLTFYLSPLADKDLFPYQAALMSKMGMDLDDAEEEIEQTDPEHIDKEFIKIMQEIAVEGIVPDRGVVKGEDEEGVREIVEDIGLVAGGGLTLEIAQDVITLSTDAESAEKFRTGRGGE